MDRRKFLAASASISIAPGCLSEGIPGKKGDRRGEGHVIEEDPRVKEPSYPIERPALPDDPDDESSWNEEYLGENMDTEPSLEFDVHRRSPLDDPIVPSGSTVFWVDILTSEGDLDELLDTDGNPQMPSEIDDVNFDDSLLILIETGWGSSDVEHRWARVEDTDDGVHVYGYYTDPLVATDDYLTRESVLEVERPGNDVELARVSLTIEEEIQVNFNSTEGPVELDS